MNIVFFAFEFGHADAFLRRFEIQCFAVFFSLRSHNIFKVAVTLKLAKNITNRAAFFLGRKNCNMVNNRHLKLTGLTRFFRLFLKLINFLKISIFSV